MNELAWEIKLTDPRTSLSFSGQAINLYLKLKDNKGISGAYKSKAFALVISGKEAEALLAYDTAIFFAGKANDPEAEAACLALVAGMFGDLGDFDKSIEVYAKGLEIALKIKNYKLMAMFYNNLADAYQNTGRNSEIVQKYLRLAREYSIKSGNKASAGLNSANLAKELADRGMKKEAETELKTALSLMKETSYGTYIYAASGSEIAYVYKVLGQDDQARKFALISYRIFDSLNRKDNSLHPLLILTDIESQSGNFAKAENYASQLLDIAKKRKAKIYIKEAYRALSAIAKSKGNPEQALMFFEQYKSWSDSVFKLEREKNIAQLEFRTNLAKRDLEIKYGLSLKEEENKRLASDNRNLKWGFTIALLAFLIFVFLGVLLLRSNNKKRQLNAQLVQKNEIVEKQAAEKDVLIQEIHHRVKNNLTMLQSLFYLQSKSASNEEVKQVLNESQTRMLSMALVHRHLYENENEGGLDMVLFIHSLLHDIVETFKSTNREIEFSATGSKTEIGIKQAIPVGLILNELITNSLKYAFKDNESGKIEAQVSEEGKAWRIDYIDNGPGLDRDFDLNNEGFGFKIIKLLCKQLKADISYNKSTGISKFSITIPKEEI